MERFIYDLVKDRPWIKDILKKIYQRVYSIGSRRYENGRDKLVVRANCFFGFHDKSPWSADNKFLLAHRFDGVGNEAETANQAVEIVIFEGQDWQQPRYVASTRAWNWQQGSQLQWRGQTGHHIVFNDFIDGVCKAVEHDVNGNMIAKYAYPVAAISPDGKAMASFCFKTFGDAMPGYGYDFSGAGAGSNIKPDTLVLFNDESQIEVEISGVSLPEAERQSDTQGVSFISHVTFSKTGQLVAFMRRLAIPGRRLRSAMYIFDRETRAIKRVPFSSMVSHYCWLNDNELFAYADTESGDGYYLYHINADTVKPFSMVLGRFDGHPNADATGENIVFDTYPDKRRLQRLAKFNIKTGNVTELARLFSPMKFWLHKRVDLHPRIRADGQYVCVDCSTTGVRSLATMKLSK